MNGRQVLTGMLLIVACSAPGGRSNEASTTWSVDPAPILDISDTSAVGPSILQSARFATRLADGTVAVADQYGNAVRFFDSKGQATRAIGRKGTGPGEFADVTWIASCGTDSLFVWAQSRRTMIVFDTAGLFAREYRPQGNPNEVTCSNSSHFAVIGLPNAYVQPSASGEVMTAPIWLADANGDSTKWLGDFPYAENRALGRLTRIALGPDALYIGTADSAWIDVFGLDGVKKRGVPTGMSPRPPTQQEYDRAIERLIAVSPNPDVRSMFRSRYAALPMPAHVPPYADLRVDSAGLLWVISPAADGRSTQLRALDDQGRVVGDVFIPLDLTVFEVGRDYILGGHRDAEDIEHVMVFRLNRA
jgi:6-bladed beta-propeller